MCNVVPYVVAFAGFTTADDDYEINDDDTPQSGNWDDVPNTDDWNPFQRYGPGKLSNACTNTRMMFYHE
jgi:hypothetical protein